jgi:hypothetical protein
MKVEEKKKIKKSRQPKNHSALSGLGTIVLILLVLVLAVVVYKNATYAPEETAAAEPTADVTPSADEPAVATPDEDAEQPEETAEPADEEEEDVMPDFNPAAVSSTQPSNLIQSTGIMVDGETVDSYTLPDTIDFGYGDDYTDVEGIVTFRGNNFRSGATFGTVKLTEKLFGDYWTVQSSSLTAPDGETWTGSGWVGQPLMMTWPKETRQNMNMYDWAKQADELTEVIYATMGGYVYFLDLETGAYTRDALYLGYTFKGAGALDPRGYPILYLGSGYDSTLGKSRVFIINLLDCSTMYTFGDNDSFNLRGNLSFFDGSPLVDAETDQLIYPGESGILYIIKLNTQYDAQAGTLSISPSRTVKWRYYGTRSASRYLGMEDSAVIWRGHIIMSDNGGNLMCLNLSTLTLDWVQDCLDDTNCSPVLELEDGHPYVYISTSFHAGWRADASSTAVIPVWKIDAETGEIVWQTEYNCYTVTGTSGGVQGTIALGKNNLSDYIYVPVGRYPSASAGMLVCLRKDTGEQVWEMETNMYSWSSPVDIYDEDGNGYIIHCTTGGYMYLVDGLTGTVLDSMNMGSNIEASPAVYNNTVVVGTRGQLIYGVKLY